MPGQMFDVMHSYAGFDELDPGTGVPRFDAVVHFAAVPRILLKSDNECLRVNTQGTYNVLDAALKMGVRKVIFASSETTYGICFADGERKPDYLPIDEDHPTIPEDSYAMSKVVNEATARSFQRRTGADIYGLRINNVVEPHEYARDFPGYVANPASGGAISSRISTRATWGIWWTAACARTGWATKCSTSPMTRIRWDDDGRAVREISIKACPSANR